MLRSTQISLKTSGLKSHQVTGAGYAYANNRFGTYWGRSHLRYANGGFGVGTYTIRKKHNPAPRPISNQSQGTSTVLSGHWRSYALADGGVLFTHPSHKQLMQWSHDVEEKEAALAGITAVSESNKAKIQSIMVDNTLENHGLAAWRRKHLWNLVKAKADAGVDDNKKTAQAELFRSVRAIGVNRRVSDNKWSAMY